MATSKEGAVDTIRCSVDVECSVSRLLTTICPVTDERDRYEVVVEWRTDSRTFEKHDLVDKIGDYTDETITQEALTGKLYDELSDGGVTGLSVTLRDTEHMDMVVTAE